MLTQLPVFKYLEKGILAYIFTSRIASVSKLSALLAQKSCQEKKKRKLPLPPPNIPRISRVLKTGIEHSWTAMLIKAS